MDRLIQNPLAQGYSRETIARNISKLRGEGIPEDRAVRIAFEEARRWFKRYNPGESILAYLRDPGERRNPINSAVNQGIDRYSRFMLRAPSRSTTMNVSPLPKVALAIGELSALEYVSNRGGETVSYRHVFKKGSRPLLASSHDGKQLILLGGAYRFGKRGIVDRRD